MKLEDIPKILEARYGRPKRKPKPLLDCLVRTILSQNTNDKLRDEAYSQLLKRFGSWKEAREATVSEIARAIRVAGLHEQKARAIKALIELASAYGYDLSFVSEMDPDQAYAFLRKIRGIGDKTAKVCLLFSFGMPFFPVDTHINRVAKRIGLAHKNWTRERVSERLERLFEPRDYYSLHLNLIELGRDLCKPREPRCGECPIRAVCSFGKRSSGSPV
ncbi:MAG: endonuclease III [candidate division WOR-3 bacterium]